jgi:hypothetical protein
VKETPELEVMEGNFQVLVFEEFVFQVMVTGSGK